MVVPPQKVPGHLGVGVVAAHLSWYCFFEEHRIGMVLLTCRVFFCRCEHLGQDGGGGRTRPRRGLPSGQDPRSGTQRAEVPPVSSGPTRVGRQAAMSGRVAQGTPAPDHSSTTDEQITDKL
jgi:hypothetical protein